MVGSSDEYKQLFVSQFLEGDRWRGVKAQTPIGARIRRRIIICIESWRSYCAAVRYGTGTRSNELEKDTIVGTR
jgi:hypothetical protein